MTKKFLIISTILLLSFSFVYANENPQNEIKCTCQNQKQKNIDNFWDEKLQLSEEQKAQLKENRIKFRKEMKQIIEEMEVLHSQIKDKYKTTSSKMQANIETAPMKAKLVTLKQKADKLKRKNRENFEKILTKEQKIKFENIKKDFAKKRKKHKP